MVVLRWVTETGGTCSVSMMTLSGIVRVAVCSCVCPNQQVGVERERELVVYFIYIYLCWL